MNLQIENTNVTKRDGLFKLQRKESMSPSLLYKSSDHPARAFLNKRSITNREFILNSPSSTKSTPRNSRFNLSSIRLKIQRNSICVKMPIMISEMKCSKAVTDVFNIHSKFRKTSLDENSTNLDKLRLQAKLSLFDKRVFEDITQNELMNRKLMLSGNKFFN